MTPIESINSVWYKLDSLSEPEVRGGEKFHSRIYVQNTSQSISQKVAAVQNLIGETIAIGIVSVYRVKSQSKSLRDHLAGHDFSYDDVLAQVTEHEG